MTSKTQDDPDQAPMASPVNDLRKLKKNSQATAAEISEFLAKMRGKSAAEVLGAVATSSLGRSFIQATVGVVAVILIFTAIPWAVGLAGGDEKTGANLPGVETQPAEPASANEASETNAAADVKPDTETPPIDIDGKGDAAKKAAADRIGVTEELTAPSNVNPLEGSNDDLLKGLE